MVGPEHQGIRGTARFWAPNTPEELPACYLATWDLVLSNLANIPEEDRRGAIDVLLEKARGVIQIPEITNEILKGIKYLSASPDADRYDVLENVEEILYYDSDTLAKDTVNTLIGLRDEITGDDFDSLLKRYAGTKFFTDSPVREGEIVDTTRAPLERLAETAISDPALLKPKLGWLVTVDAKNSNTFGYALGELDKELNFLPDILNAIVDAAEEATAFFLSGYLRRLYENDLAAWENLLDQLAGDIKLYKLIPEITFRCGLTDRAAERYLGLIETDSSLLSYSNLFVFGGEINKISDHVFGRWLDSLMQEGNLDAWATALSLFYVYYVHGKEVRPLPERTTFEILFSDTGLRLVLNPGGRPMVSHEWMNIAEKFIKYFPTRISEVTTLIFGAIDDPIAFPDTVSSVLIEMTKANPAAVWLGLTPFLGPQLDLRTYRITRWLRGSRYWGGHGEFGALKLFPPDAVWEWVEDDVRVRARLLASAVPPYLFSRDGETCFARELLSCYGESEEVREALVANFSTEGWKGPRSEHLSSKIRELEEFAQDEEDRNVKSWIAEYVASLKKRLETVRIEEERRGY